MPSHAKSSTIRLEGELSILISSVEGCFDASTSLMLPLLQQDRPTDGCMPVQLGIQYRSSDGTGRIAYASRSLTRPERQYSVIERESLAAVFAIKHFRHYLLGRPFIQHTDHQSLQWLTAQKMEGRLCRWALAMQEFDLEIKY